MKIEFKYLAEFKYYILNYIPLTMSVVSRLILLWQIKILDQNYHTWVHSNTKWEY